MVFKVAATTMWALFSIEKIWKLVSWFIDYSTDISISTPDPMYGILHYQPDISG